MSTTPQIAAQTLSEMGGRATALKLCQKLCQDGHTQRDSQLAIQRAFDKGLIVVERDLTLRVGNL